jgi:hypothetical protein
MQNLRKGEQNFLKTAASLGCLLLLILVGCAGAPVSLTSPLPTPSRAALTAAPLSTNTPLPTPGPTPNPSPNSSPTGTQPNMERGVVILTPILGASPMLGASPSPSPTALPPDFWQKMPIIPTQISARVREIYQSGLAVGNNPHVFSRIGDCASAAPAFLVSFDTNYNLGNYASLQPAIDYFKGSFERPSLAAKAGLNSAGLLTTLWTGPQCQKDESLLDCQYRLDRPSFALISIGTNEAYYVHENPGSFEHNLRIILDDTIARGIVPVLGTKADDVEGDGSINASIARLALEYQLPLWNFWLAVQPLPDHGMVAPEHLSSVSYLNFADFSIPNSLEYGMQVRNLTALQMLDFLRESLAGNPSKMLEAASSPPRKEPRLPGLACLRHCRRRYRCTLPPWPIRQDRQAQVVFSQGPVLACTVPQAQVVLSQGHHAVAQGHSGASASRIAKWDVTAWSALGSDMNAEVYAVILYGSGDLYAGGMGTCADGQRPSAACI